MKITVEPLNLAAVQRAMHFNEGGMKRAAQSAIKKSLRAGKKKAVEGVKRRYTLPSSIINMATKIVASGLSGKMTTSGKRNPLEKAKVSKGRGAIHATVVRGQGGVISRAFRKKYHPAAGIFARVGRPRLPIKKLKTVSAPGMASHPVVSKPVERVIEQTINKELIKAAETLL